MNGFRIKQLILTGKNVAPKYLPFEKGLNLLTGPSNTGKTYVFQCIDFVLGRSKCPKKIKQSNGYEEVFLEIEEYSSGKISTISRSLANNKSFFYKNTPYKNIADTTPEPLDGKNTNESVSSLILGLCGFNQLIKIKKNQDFNTVNFSFRNLAPYILIKEDAMILERSPIYTGSYTDRTLWFNIFKFLLTGNDDSSLKKTEKKEIWSAKKNANIELLNQLLDDEIDKLNTLEQKKVDYSGIKFSEESTNQIELVQNNICSLNDKLSINEGLKNKIKSDITYNENLKYKFSLLREQYFSDIERLQFIDEGSFLFNQLNVTKCPHCGKSISEFEKHNHKDINMSEVNEACNFEIEKIRINLLELEKSSQTVDDVLERLQYRIAKVDNDTKAYKNQLKNVLQPQLINLQKEWDNSLQYEIILSEIASVNSQIEHLQTLIFNTTSKKHSVNGNFNEEIIKIINESSFPTLLGNNLKKCLFHDDEALLITFYMNSDKELDFLIKGEERETFGKGYRSIIASIFHITLMIYCKEKKLPHLNLLILDSPVNAFKDTDINEKLPESVQNRFFEFLSKSFKNEQIIVIENDSVLDALVKEINLLEFTRDEFKGRYGFF